MSQIVKKANYLIPYHEALSKPAQLLASFLVACVNQRTKTLKGVIDLPVMEFNYREIRNALNADGKTRVSKVNDVFELGIELQRAVLFYAGERQKKTVTWIIEQALDEDTNLFTYTMHPKLSYYLLNLEREFTTYLYYCRICLNSNAMKLYEILKMYEYLGKVELDLEEDLKKPLGLTGRYKKYYELRRWVIDVAQKEFDQYTDISFTYEPKKKKGKKVVSIEVTITANTPTDLPTPLLEAVDKYKDTKKLSIPSKTKKPKNKVAVTQSTYPEIYKQLLAWGGRVEDVDSLLAKYGAERMAYYITYTKRQLKVGKVAGTPFGYYRSGIQQNWTDPIQEKAKLEEEKKKKSLERKSIITTLQNKRRDLVDAYLNERREYTTQYFKEHRTELNNLFEEIKEMKAYQVPLNKLYKRKGKGVSATDAYKDKNFGWGAIIVELHHKKPALFASLVDKYKPQVEECDKELRLNKIRPNVVFWGI